ncbi:MAG: hypothetical protein OXD29_13110 [Roseovarius sp.]|nr:hypothetical protein [Roseovarius sp.]
MRDALCIIDTDDMSIAGASLQYIDVFDWTSDPNEYDVFQLLDVESEYVPKSVGMYGSVWHLHQGWFDPINNPVSGRILKKAHFDAISTSESGQPTVKLDTLLRADFSNYISARTFFQESSDLEKMFIYMHNSNKKLVSSFLTKAICKNIGLEDEQ